MPRLFSRTYLVPDELLSLASSEFSNCDTIGRADTAPMIFAMSKPQVFFGYGISEGYSLHQTGEY